MSLIPEHCFEFDEIRSFCVAEQKGKVYRLENLSGFRICKVKVDGCIEQETGEKRCDFLLMINEKQARRALFIELKGGKIIQAMKQLYDTIIYLKSDLPGYRIDARIVGSRDAPQFLNSPDYKKLNRLIRQFNGDIKRATNNFLSETI